MRGELVRRLFAAPEAYLNRQYYLRWRSDAVQALVGSRRFRRVLDYGCGDGSLSIPLLGQADQLVLFDTSPAMLRAARARVPVGDAARVVITDGRDSAWRDAGPADLVLCIGVLAHVEDPWQTLEHVASLVARGGVAIVELTDAGHLVGRAQVIYSRLRFLVRRGTYPWNLLFATDVLRFCKERGLELQASYRYGLPFQLGGLLPDDFIYRFGLRLFGDVAASKSFPLSCERLYYLVRP
jgi:2-polyprenyl-3-methyl-5-hydroxy-6-metoxy-1,4-benzoquinol methylase